MSVLPRSYRRAPDDYADYRVDVGQLAERLVASGHVTGHVTEPRVPAPARIAIIAHCAVGCATAVEMPDGAIEMTFTRNHGHARAFDALERLRTAGIDGSVRRTDDHDPNNWTLRAEAAA